MKLLFRAQYSFKSETTKPFTEQSGTIQYEADSNDDASKDFARWWENRHKAAPEYFQVLYAIKIHSIVLQRIDETGYLPSGVQPFYVFEWKYDWPWAKDIWQKLKESDL